MVSIIERCPNLLLYFSFILFLLPFPYFFLNFIELKMAVHRFQMASNKKGALLKQNMRQVAVLLAEDPPKEEKARIKAEALIRDDYVSQKCR